MKGNHIMMELFKHVKMCGCVCTIFLSKQNVFTVRPQIFYNLRKEDLFLENKPWYIPIYRHNVVVNINKISGDLIPEQMLIYTTHTSCGNRATERYFVFSSKFRTHRNNPERIVCIGISYSA